MPRHRGAALVLALLLITAASEPAEARGWAAFSSDNFTIYSDRSERDVLRTLEQFELFRQVALNMLQVADEPESTRLRIFLFDKKVDFNRMQGDMDVSGFFFRSLSGPRMLVSDEGEDDTLFHEYVHYLMSRNSNINYPRWYSEGLAETLDTIEFEDSSVRVGVPTDNFEFISSFAFLSDGHVHAPVGEMISVEPRVGVIPFYATAWLMVHYFFIDSADDPERLQQTADYLLRFDAGEDPTAAFKTSFGITPREMDMRLDRYIRDRQFKTLVFPGMSYDGELSKRELGDDEERYLLADLAIELSQYEAAEPYLEQFRRRGRNSPLAPRVQAIQAIADIHEQRIDAGDRLIEQLLARNVDDAEALTKIMHYSVDRALYARDNDEGTFETYVERAIGIGEAVLRSEPGYPEALYYLGRAYELGGELELAAQRLLEFFASDPTVPEVNLLLTKVFVAAGNSDVGAEFLARVYSASHSDEGRAMLNEIEGQLHDIEAATRGIEILLDIAEGHMQAY